MMKAVLVLIALILLGLNLKASLLILKDSISEPKLRVFQLLFVWLIPVFGALLVLGIHRPTEKSSGQYPEERQPQDGFLGGNTGTQIYDEVISND